jgi:hypothetical protein
MPEKSESPFTRFTPKREIDDTIVHVPLPDDFMVPRRFLAETETLLLDIEVDSSGAARCLGLQVRGRDGEAITAESLRAIPVARLTRQAVAGAARRYTPLEEVGEPVFRLVSTPPEAAAAFYERYVKEGRRPRRGSPITDDNLREVARIYREAVKRDDPPTKTVGDTMHTARSTAARWVTAARERGFLGPALRGKGGEA